MKSKGIQTYERILREETRKKFNEHYLSRLKNGLDKYFGERRSKHILCLLANGTLELTSPETFFFSGKNIEDPAIELYNDSKSIEEFLFRYLGTLKRMLSSGCTNITICELFWVLSDYYNAHKKEFVVNKPEYVYLKSLIQSVITFMCSPKENSPFIVRILDARLKEVATKTGLNMTSYFTILKHFFIELEKINKWNRKAFKLPRFEMYYGIYNDIRQNAVNCVATRLRVRDEIVNGMLKNVPDLTKDSLELRTALKSIAALNDLTHFDCGSLVLELERIGKIPKMKVFEGDRSLTSTFTNSGIPRSAIKKYKIAPVFANLELFAQGARPAFCEVTINCIKVRSSKTTPFPRIEGWIDYAKDLCLMKRYAILSIPSLEPPVYPLFKIVLSGVKSTSQEFVTQVKEKAQQIKSLTNQDFVIEINYDQNVVNKKIDFTTTSHFRVIGDLHVDINEDKGYLFNFGEDFVLDCGDTAGNSRMSSDWLKEHIKCGVTVAGNHLGYSHTYPERDGIQNLELWNSTTHLSNTKNGQIKDMTQDFHSTNIRLLSNSESEFKGIKIFGTCLYSDFNLYGTDHREECMAYAKKYMNDFKYIEVSNHADYVYLGDGKWQVNHKSKFGGDNITKFTPNEHAYYFFYSLNYLKEKVAEYREQPVIIVTHFAPSFYSVADQYKNDILSAAFASDLNDFIVKNPNIRLWCHGHTHVPFDYILGETRVVCCPFGYYNENNYELPFNYGTRIAVDDVKSMTSWKKLCKKEIKEGLIKVYKD